MKPFAYLGGSRNRGQGVTEVGCNMKDPLHSDESPSPRPYPIMVLEPPQKSTTRWEPIVAAHEPVGALHIQATAHGKCSTFFCVCKCRSKVLFLKMLGSSGGPGTVSVSGVAKYEEGLSLPVWLKLIILR